MHVCKLHSGWPDRNEDFLLSLQNTKVYLKQKQPSTAMSRPSFTMNANAHKSLKNKLFQQSILAEINEQKENQNQNNDQDIEEEKSLDEEAVNDILETRERGMAENRGLLEKTPNITYSHQKQQPQSVFGRKQSGSSEHSFKYDESTDDKFWIAGLWSLDIQSQESRIIAIDWHLTWY